MTGGNANLNQHLGNIGLLCWLDQEGPTPLFISCCSVLASQRNTGGRWYQINPQFLPSSKRGPHVAPTSNTKAKATPYRVTTDRTNECPVAPDRLRCLQARPSWPPRLPVYDRVQPAPATYFSSSFSVIIASRLTRSSGRQSPKWTTARRRRLSVTSSRAYRRGPPTRCWPSRSILKVGSLRFAGQSASGFATKPVLVPRRGLRGT